MCIGFLLDCLDRKLFDFPPNARVLEIGCAEADTAGEIKKRRPDLHVTGFDWRDAPECTADEKHRGDILITQKFDGKQFDVVLAVSTIEHVGLSAYGDPEDVDGDTKVMKRISGWLKPGGICYLDVPYRPDGKYKAGSQFRAYDAPQLHQRLIEPSGLTQTAEQFFKGDHPDGPYIAVVLQK